MNAPLTPADHNRHIAGMTYVYPVMSRRAGGLSIGINFNPNNACNWRCVYCQVPDLQRGTAPDMDFAKLSAELNFVFDYVLNGQFFDDYQVPVEQRQIKDLAISGNGESTSLKRFDQAVALIGEIGQQWGLFPDCRFILISNGSLIHQSHVQQGLKTLAKFNGEVWFKIDSASAAGRELINHCSLSDRQLMTNLELASQLCTTRIQTCMLHFQNAWSSDEQQAYLDLLARLKTQQIKIAEVLLYSLARQSFQAEATEISSYSLAELETMAEAIRALGYSVKATP